MQVLRRSITRQVRPLSRNVDEIFSKKHGTWSLSALFDKDADEVPVVTTEELHKAQSLSYLQLSSDEFDQFEKDVVNLVSFASRGLGSVDVDGVEPLVSPLELIDTSLEERPDEVTDGDIRQDILRNSANTDLGFFVVPRRTPSDGSAPVAEGE